MIDNRIECQECPANDRCSSAIIPLTNECVKEIQEMIRGIRNFWHSEYKIPRHIYEDENDSCV